MIIKLPFPPRQLFLNYKMCWKAKMNATRIARYGAKCEAMEQSREHRWTPYDKDHPCDMFIIWYPPDNRVRDHEALLAASKPFIDGLVDAGLLKGDSGKVIRDMGHRIESHNGNPRTIIQITPASIGGQQSIVKEGRRSRRLTTE